MTTTRRLQPPPHAEWAPPFKADPWGTATLAMPSPTSRTPCGAGEKTTPTSWFRPRKVSLQLHSFTTISYRKSNLLWKDRKIAIIERILFG